MITTIRAALSVLMLLGFYLFAFGLVAAMGVATVLLWQDHSGPAVAKLGYVTIAVGVAIVVALWRVMRAKPEVMPGLPVSEAQAPELWRMVRELAAVANTRVPDEILLIPMVNAAVTEDARLLGLVGGRRRLYLGVPLLQAFTVAQLRSVLAHELGHYSRNHTRLGEIAYRGREAIVATVQRLSGNLVGWLLKQYAKLYMLVGAAVSRRQELEADELSVRVAGRATAQATLRELPVIDAAWGFYERRYIDPGWEAGYAPTAADFFGGFGQMLEARADELASMRSAPPPEDGSRWDSHPSIAVRVAAMDAMADVAVAADNRPAADVLPDFDRASEAVATRSVQFDNRKQLPWDEFSGASVLTQEQREADLIYRAAARLRGTGGAGLSDVLELVEAGRLGELAEDFFPGATRREARAKFAGPMTLLLRVAAVRSGAAAWRHSWSGPPTLVGRSGDVPPLEEVAALAIVPDTVAEARARMAALGIDVAAAVVVDRVATAHGGDIIGGLANVSVNGAPHDVLILDNGLILKSCPKKTDGGKNRLIALVQSAPVAELARDNAFLPFEEIAAATVVKTTPIRVELTMRDGRTLRIFEAWTGERLAKNSSEVLHEVIKPFLAAPVGG
jgi:Zn-dependent protease with chaperone function